MRSHVNRAVKVLHPWPEKQTLASERPSMVFRVSRRPTPGPDPRAQRSPWVWNCRPSGVPPGGGLPAMTAPGSRPSACCPGRPSVHEVGCCTHPCSQAELHGPLGTCDRLRGQVLSGSPAARSPVPGSSRVPSACCTPS